MGKNIYDSFKPFENTFGSTYLYILKIGEFSGNIVESLEDISKSLDFDLSQRKKLGRNFNLSHSSYLFNFFNSEFLTHLYLAKLYYNF